MKLYQSKPVKIAREVLASVEVFKNLMEKHIVQESQPDGEFTVVKVSGQEAALLFEADKLIKDNLGRAERFLSNPISKNYSQTEVKSLEQLVERIKTIQKEFDLKKNLVPMDN